MLDFLAFSITSIIFFTLGYFSKGITINVNSKENEAPTEYNESMVEYMDPETRRYYEQNNGLNKY